MGWSEVNGQRQDAKVAEAEEQKRKDAERALRQAVTAALSGGNQAPFREFLERMAMAASYAPGRAHADITFAEGQRALAAKLLELGGANGRSRK